MCKTNGILVVIGAGPAGLMAAESALAMGAQVHVYDAMPSVGRKFLMAGRGGLNLTHGEDFAAVTTRYGASAPRMRPMLEAFGPARIVEWCGGLGIETFTGSSKRIFPKDFKAAPLLRAWVRRLKDGGVRFHLRHRWLGWDEQGRLRFQTPDGIIAVEADATLLALGGGSWPSLGSDGTWLPVLADRGIACAPLAPSNCGFDVDWSPHIKSKFAGHPLKSICLRFDNQAVKGDIMITETGIEGTPVYALSSALRERITRNGRAVVSLDLAPDRPPERLAAEIAQPKGSRSLSNHLKRQAGLSGLAVALLHETGNLSNLAKSIKALPITLLRPRPLAEAISSAGGVTWEEVDDDLMIKRRPGLFVAGEMLDWEAPTGGYLLTGCFATGYRAGRSAAQFLAARSLKASINPG